jgi:hypothetical protein
MHTHSVIAARFGQLRPLSIGSGQARLVEGEYVSNRPLLNGRTEREVCGPSMLSAFAPGSPPVLYDLFGPKVVPMAQRERADRILLLSVRDDPGPITEHAGFAEVGNRGSHTYDAN